MVKEQRMKKHIIKAISVKWGEWQSWFIEKATKEETNSWEILLVYDPKENTGKSYLNTMFSLLHSDETCNLQKMGSVKTWFILAVKSTIWNMCLSAWPDPMKNG